MASRKSVYAETGRARMGRMAAETCCRHCGAYFAAHSIRRRNGWSGGHLYIHVCSDCYRAGSR